MLEGYSVAGTQNNRRYRAKANIRLADWYHRRVAFLSLRHQRRVNEIGPTVARVQSPQSNVPPVEPGANPANGNPVVTRRRAFTNLRSRAGSIKSADLVSRSVVVRQNTAPADGKAAVHDVIRPVSVPGFRRRQTRPRRKVVRRSSAKSQNFSRE